MPAISVNLPTRSASLVRIIDCGEKSAGPKPKCHTILPFGSTSITRLLNWSAIRVLWLEIVDSCAPEVVTVLQKGISRICSGSGNGVQPAFGT